MGPVFDHCAVARADADRVFGQLLHGLRVGIPLELVAQIAAEVKDLLRQCSDERLGRIGQGLGAGPDCVLPAAFLAWHRT